VLSIKRVNTIIVQKENREMVGYFEMEPETITEVKVGWSGYAVHPNYGTQVENREAIAHAVEKILIEKGMLKEKDEFYLPKSVFEYVRVGDAPYEGEKIHRKSKTGRLMECIPVEAIDEIPPIEQVTVTLVTRLWYLEKMWEKGEDAEYKYIEEQPITHVILSVNATSANTKKEKRAFYPIAY
jgi:hypothetical protein